MEIVPDETTLLLTHVPFHVSASLGEVKGFLPFSPQLKRKVTKANEAVVSNMYLLIMSLSDVYSTVVILLFTASTSAASRPSPDDYALTSYFTLINSAAIHVIPASIVAVPLWISRQVFSLTKVSLS